MAERKPYLLRVSPELLDELATWAKDDLRSLNAQIEFVLREAVHRRRGPMPEKRSIERNRATPPIGSEPPD